MWLFYNPFEAPARVRIISKTMNVNMEYDPMSSDPVPAYFMSTLFNMSYLECFDDIQVLCDDHLEGYIKKSKKATIGKKARGWISLKECRNGGGYLSDKYLEDLEE